MTVKRVNRQGRQENAKKVFHAQKSHSCVEILKPWLVLPYFASFASLAVNFFFDCD